MFFNDVTYFPYITLPDNDPLIKASILYWDNIHLLTHPGFRNDSNNGNLGSTTKFLESKNILKADFIDNSVPDFEKRIKEFSSCGEFLKCYESKFPKQAMSEMISRRLVKSNLDNDGTCFVDKNLALAYIHEAAMQNSNIQKTDLLTDSSLNFGAFTNLGLSFDENKVARISSKSRRFISVLMKRVLVVPGSEVSYQEILDFKNLNKDKYHLFRREMSTSFSGVRDSFDELSDERILKILKDIREMTDDCINTLAENRFKKYIRLGLDFCQMSKFPLVANSSVLSNVIPDKNAVNPCYIYCALAKNKFIKA